MQTVEAVFTACYEQHESLVRSFAARLLSQPRGSPQIDDLVQDTFTRLWQAMQLRGVRFEAAGTCRSYLCRIALNLVRDQERRRHIVSLERLPSSWERDALDEEPSRRSPAPVSDPVTDVLDQLLDVKAALARFSATSRVLVLRAATGEAMRSPVEKNRLARARAALRRACLEEEERRRV